jgi:cytochrome d ubiquinol oxidase subunit I
MANAAAFSQTLHMTLAAYAATGFAVAGIHAFILLRKPDSAFHRLALRLALLVAVPAALLQPLSGDISARMVARTQPAKLAAMEGQFTTERGAPLRIGGRGVAHHPLRPRDPVRVVAARLPRSAR